MNAPARHPAFILCSLVAALFVVGCSRKQYREWADREVYKVIDKKREAALNEKEPFTINPSTEDLVKSLPRKYQPLLPEGAESETRPSPEEYPGIISFNKAIEIAVQTSREYQSNKEDLYLSALSLTGERHRWSPRFSAMLSGEYAHAESDDTWAGDGSFGVRQLLATGGSLSLDFATNVLRYITSDPRESASSAISATLIQPLWRGAGRRIAQENLRQAEREVIYEVRSFARYHRTFAVSIASNYLRTLEQRQRVRNFWDNYQRRVTSREQMEEMARAGRRAEFEVDQARQEELSGRNDFVTAEQQYRESLDSFKLALGLPTDANVDVDADDFQRLLDMGIVHPDISREAAVSQALALRLDLLNASDQVEDAAHKVDVAYNGLAPDVDLVLSANASTQDNKPAEVRFENGRYSAGVNVGLPVDRKLERNTLRRAEISLDRSARSYTDLRDRIMLQVRQAWRTLQERRESYEIQRMSLNLAERRVESTTLLLQAGRATTRDVLDAQSALLNAQNAVLGALIDHTVARLELWRDTETLLVTPDGKLEAENQNSQRQETSAGVADPAELSVGR